VGKVDKEYTFDISERPKTLAQLFDGRSQLRLSLHARRPGAQGRCVRVLFLADHV